MNPHQMIAYHFEIQDLLGRGGMGDVYRAADTQTGEIFAVKALNPEVIERDPSILERFVLKGEALRQLNHSNAVKKSPRVLSPCGALQNTLGFG